MILLSSFFHHPQPLCMHAANRFLHVFYPASPLWATNNVATFDTEAQPRAFRPSNSTWLSTHHPQSTAITSYPASERIPKTPLEAHDPPHETKPITSYRDPEAPQDYHRAPKSTDLTYTRSETRPMTYPDMPCDDKLGSLQLYLAGLNTLSPTSLSIRSERPTNPCGASSCTSGKEARAIAAERNGPLGSNPCSQARDITHCIAKERNEESGKQYSRSRRRSEEGPRERRND